MKVKGLTPGEALIAVDKGEVVETVRRGVGDIVLRIWKDKHGYLWDKDNKPQRCAAFPLERDSYHIIPKELTLQHCLDMGEGIYPFSGSTTNGIEVISAATGKAFKEIYTSLGPVWVGLSCVMAKTVHPDTRFVREEVE